MKQKPNYGHRLKFEEFGDEYYRIIIIPNTGGCWLIQNMKTMKQTNLFTGSEGMEIYREIKWAYRSRKPMFHAKCQEYTYD